MGYKGFGLSLVVDILGGVLTGAGITVSKKRRPGGNGVSIICIPMSDLASQKFSYWRTKF